MKRISRRGVLAARGALPPFHALSHPPPRACRRPDAAGIRETTGQPGARKPGIRWYKRGRTPLALPFLPDPMPR